MQKIFHCWKCCCQQKWYYQMRTANANCGMSISLVIDTAWILYYPHRICFRLSVVFFQQLQDIGTGVIKSFHGNWRFFCSSLSGLGGSTNIIEDLSSSKSHSPWSQKRSKAGAKTFFWPSIKYKLCLCGIQESSFLKCCHRRRLVS